VDLTEKLDNSGRLTLSRKETYGKPKDALAFTSRRGYEQSLHHFDIRNVLDVKGFLKEIKDNWHTYVSQVHQWIQKNSVKSLIVTGIFTIVLGCFASTSNAENIQEYIYQVKKGENIETISKDHGVTPQEILQSNGISSIDGKKILLPKVEDSTVTATTLNVRSQPDTQSNIIETYKKGDVVKVAFFVDGWAGILIKGRVCFVRADYLSPTTQATTQTTTQTTTMYVTASSLRIRESASTNSAVLGWLNVNDRIEVISIENGWAKINFNSKTAYVSAELLTSTAPAKTETSSSVYVIKQGDNFWSIANSLGVSVQSIQQLNPTVDASKLKIGQKITIPATAQAAANQIKVTAYISGVDPDGTFRFITPDGTTYAAKASGNLINDLFDLEGKQATFVLEGKRGQLLTLVSIH
jgi:uncharacterized protein YgiM (DUF1202 family)